MLRLATAIHSHDHGSDGYLFTYDDSGRMPDEAAVAFALGINWDSNKENLDLANVQNVSMSYESDAAQADFSELTQVRPAPTPD